MNGPEKQTDLSSGSRHPVAATTDRSARTPSSTGDASQSGEASTEPAPKDNDTREQPSPVEEPLPGGRSGAPRTAPGTSPPKGADDPTPHWLKAGLGGLALAALFVALVASLVWARTLLPDDALEDVAWLVLLAAILLLPLLVARWPDAFRTLGNRVQSVSIAGVFEVNLGDVSAVTETRDIPDDVWNQLNDAAAPEQDSELTSTAAVQIVHAVKRVYESEARVFSVDLGFGERTWRLPNLYFLADLLERKRTKVRRLVFVAPGTETDDGNASRLFIGMCSPKVLRAAIETHHEEFKRAADALERRTVHEPTEDLELKAQFDVMLDHLGASKELRGWVTETTLERYVGRHRLEADVLDTPGSLTADDCRRIINWPDPFVAVTAGPYLRTVIDRDSLALEVARSVAKLTTGSAMDTNGPQ
jgi:hypothetical protein